MAKYNTDFKQNVVIEYLGGTIGLKSLARKHGMKSHSSITKWLKAYEKYGTNGLERKETHKTYDSIFKLNVLEYMKTTRTSLMNTAVKFNIPDYAIISTWNRVFSEGGLEALSKTKGRQRIHMSNTKKTTTKAKKELTKEQILEKENLLLRIENEYLKKLHAHGLKQMEAKLKKK